MAAFNENLAQLASIGHLSALELLDGEGQVAARIENKPGSQGSLRVYYHLGQRRGLIGAAEAEEGLRIFAEHTEDARARPGAHPNIDRLLAIVRDGGEYRVRAVTA